MTLRQLVGILMDSPLYFTINLVDRLVLINLMMQLYQPRFC